MQIYTRSVKASPYSSSVLMVLCDSIDAARKELKVKPSDKSNWDTGCIGQVFLDTGKYRRNYNLYMFINVPEHASIRELMDTFSHETVHLIDRVFDRAGVDTDYNNNEPYAYLLGNMVGELWDLFYKVQSPTFCTKEGYIEIKPPQVEAKPIE
jgi:hypothetical protein